MNSKETEVIKKHLVWVGSVHSITGQHKGKNCFCESQMSLLLSYSLYLKTSTGVPFGMTGSPALEEEQYCQLDSHDIDENIVCLLIVG